MRNQIRQGDVLLVPVDGIPASAKEVAPAKGLPPILAYGETTGHAHGLYGRAKMFRDDGAGGATYIRAEEGTVLAHGTPIDAVTIPRDPDHAAIPLDGFYRVVRQVEFPRAAPQRQVAD
jgi:hypothetical protein